MRGNRGGPSGAAGVGGSIPAYAGEPSRPVRVPSGGGVYPRVCGGTAVIGFFDGLIDGLSPRMRGNPRYAPAAVIPRRSIPAYAGEPPGCQLRPRRNGVYPRVCGGTWYDLYLAPTLPGLSPRMRGNHVTCVHGITKGGSIPAYAGEPRIPVMPPHRLGVYPRVCGGTTLRRAREPQERGLSPRMRGNPN